MGRKKGRQAGEFHSKSLNAQHRHTVYVDHASDANQYRNPLQSADLGRGLGFRTSSSSITDTSGYWHTNGSVYGGGDKWSSIFNSTQRSGNNSSNRAAHVQINSNNAYRATMGLSRLRFLLEERRSEDRVNDRQHRLRLQRSRMVQARNDAYLSSGCTSDEQYSTKNDSRKDRHEPGWILSHSLDRQFGSDNVDRDQNQTTLQSSSNENGTYANAVPSLQKLAAQKLGPLLPEYCAACGSDFVGESLKSVNCNILEELSISLAKSDWSFEGNQDDGAATLYATTDGVVKALVNSGVATGLVLRGAPLLSSDENNLMNEDDEDDSRWLSDEGLLTLCPRILPNAKSDFNCNNYSNADDCDDESCSDNWETIDFDAGLNSRMAGCFHLKRLELIDIPLCQHGTSGVSLPALRRVFKTCPSITHLSLSGCFYNWEDSLSSQMTTTEREGNDVSMLLCGNRSLASVVHSIRMLGQLHDNGEQSVHHIRQILFHQMSFQESIDRNNEIAGADTLLPELEVLDVSHCAWVSPGMLIQFVLKFWERAFKTTSGQLEDAKSDGRHWDSTDAVDECIGNRDCAADSTTSLRHLNIRGCTGLLPSDSTTLPTWMEEWQQHGLFNGIDVSTERQVRR